MAQIVTLREDVHEYYKPDGTTVPSVSEILRFMSREIYGGITQWTLDNAADRGTRVHKACEILDKWGSVECDADIEPYVQAYVKFRRDHKPEWANIEFSTMHPERQYAGTLDRVGLLQKKWCILDIKVQSTIKKPMVSAQLNGYTDMYHAAHGRQVEMICALQLKADGTYKLYEFDIDNAYFDACYVLHKALEKKPRKKKGNADGNTDE